MREGKACRVDLCWFMGQSSIRKSGGYKLYTKMSSKTINTNLRNIGGW